MPKKMESNTIEDTQQKIIQKDSFLDYLKEAPNYLSNFLLPFYFTTASTMLIEMGDTFGIRSSDISLIFTFFIIGAILGQLTSVLYNRKFKKVVIVVSAYVFITVILTTLLFAKNIFIFYTLYFLMGYCSGVILIQAMQYLLENRVQNKDRLTLIFLIFYPLGSLTAPFLASFLIRNDINWRYSYIILAVASVLVMISYLLIKGRKESIRQDTEEKIPIKKIFTDSIKNRLFIFGLVLIFFYSIAETVMATWSPTFLRMARGFDVTSAGFAVTAFWLGILAGRVIVSFIAGRTRVNLLLLILSAMGFTALIFFIVSRTGNIIILFSAIAGLGNSAILPLSISSTSTVYKKGRGILVSIVFAVNNAAISLTPILTRMISGRDITLSVVLAPLTILIGALVAAGKIIFERRQKI